MKPPPALPISQLPPGYREVVYWRITASRKRVVLANLLAIALLPVSAWLSLGAMRIAGVSPEGFALTVPMVLLAALALVPLHEGVHGLAVLAFGVKPRFGILWKALAFYTTVPDRVFKRWVFWIFLLAPLVLLSVLFPLAAVFLEGEFWRPLIFLMMVLNGAGSAGDLYMALVLLRYSSSAYVADEKDGMRIFLPAD